MVKVFTTLIFFSLTPVQSQIEKDTKNSCSSLIVSQAREAGFRSLSFSEKIQYHIDLRKCENKNFVKAVKKEVKQNQLDSDLDRSKNFTGKSSSFAYCIILFITYLTVN
jgi:hypothetical protein